MKKINFVVVMIIAILALVGCESGSGANSNKKSGKVAYVKGNPFAEKFGANNPHVFKFQSADIASGIKGIPGVGQIIYDLKFSATTNHIIEKEIVSDSDPKGFYTGSKEEGGQVYTWFSEPVTATCFGEYLGSGSAFTKPVWVYDANSDKNPVPFMAYVDENNQIVPCFDKNPLPEGAFQVCIDIVDSTDIYYCGGYPNQIQNEYFKLSAFGVVIGEVAMARAEVNKNLLKDVAVLTGAKVGLTDADTDIEYSEEDLAVMKEKLDSLDQQIQDKFKLGKQMTKAVNQAIGAAVAQGVTLGKQIVEDVARLTQMTLAMDKAGIANYFIELYGSVKEDQELGKFASKLAKTNFDYGNQQMKIAKEIMQKQEQLFNAILADEE